MKDAWRPDPIILNRTTPFDALGGKLDINQTLEVEESDEIESARRCMDSRDYLRASYYAKGCRSPQGVFLYVYSQFLVSEQTAVADWHKSDGTRFQPPLPVNTSIGELLEIIEATQDPFLKFLKAIFYKRLSRMEDAISLLLESLSSYPWNWSAWLLLESCIDSTQELIKAMSRLTLPQNHPLLFMLRLKTANDLYAASATDLKACDALLGRNHFPNSLWLMAQRARTLYIHAAFSKAESQFEQIMKIDPNRIDDIDVYANILYATQKREKLSSLADKFSEKDRDRPEICCVLGNICSMRLEHEKAVKYFKRATRLDPTCLQAWTHLGFEFMEIANPPAAIEAFRRAVDISKKDYRPWYGMAQAYMVLNLPLYALYYYSKAGDLRYTLSANDSIKTKLEIKTGLMNPRFWREWLLVSSIWGGEPETIPTFSESALTQRRYQEAIACYRRMITRTTNPLQIVALHLKTAKTYRAAEDAAGAAHCHALIVKTFEAEAIEGSYKLGQSIPDQYLRSMVECAEYHARAQDGNLLLAHDYLKACLVTPGCPPEVTATLTFVRTRARQIGTTLADDEGRWSMDHRKGLLAP
ncbi:Anaphase-promoting complex subunit 8 [Marasmius crinis-equi]|uniref:Anaphase-promoting complex subunit 8 n=1 Tax=Marasmius crinis-equi TaxID=585013 RepID=A0ABR3FRV1_9AGAR